MKFCSNCGAPATGTAYCGNCGKPMTVSAAAAGGSAAGGPVTGSPVTGGPGAVPGAGPGAVPGGGAARANPFSDIPVLDYARDVIALILLLVSFGMPWDLSDTVTGKVYVILVTLLSVISLSLPYLKRGGVLPESWGTAELRLARLAANAPYVVVVLITLVLGYIGENDGDGVGVGIAFGLAGALLAAQGREAEQTAADGGDGALWRWIALGIGALFALLTVISLIIFLTGDDAEFLEWEQVTYLAVTMLFFLALAALPLWGVFRGDAAWRDVLVLLGAVALFVGVWQLGADETMSDAWDLGTFGPQLILVPALAVAAAAPGLRSTYQAAAGAAHWAAVAIRMFQVAMLVAVAGVVFYVLNVIAVDEGRGLAIVVLVLMLILLVAALVGRNALVRDPNQGRAIAVVCGGVFILLGIVIASILGASDDGIVAIPDATIVSVLWWFGVALIVVLTAPASVRTEYGPIGANQLSLSSVLPGGGSSESRESGATASGTAAGAAGTATAAGEHDTKERGPAGDTPTADAGDAGERDADQPSDVPASPAVPGDLDDAPESAAPASGAVGDEPAAEPVRDDVPVTEEPIAEPADADGTPAGPLVGQDRPGLISDLAVGPEPSPDDTATRIDQPRVEPATRVDQAAVTDADLAESSSGIDARTALDPNTPLQTLADIAAQEPGLRKYIAANPSTYPELLTWLGQLGDPEIDEALRRRNN